MAARRVVLFANRRDGWRRRRQAGSFVKGELSDGGGGDHDASKMAAAAEAQRVAT